MPAITQLTILAPGLLGGSVARAARQRDVAQRIVLWTRRPESRLKLRAQPWCDAVADTPNAAVRGADLVVIAAPVDQIVPLARQIAPDLAPGTLVTDEFGWLCRATTAEGLAETIQQAFAAGSGTRSRGLAARSLYLRSYTPREATRRLMEIYDGLAQPPAHGADNS